MKRKGSVPRADIDPAKTTLDPAAIERVFAGVYKGELANGVYKIVIGRTPRWAGTRWARPWESTPDDLANTLKQALNKTKP